MKQKTEIDIEISETISYTRRNERFETLCPKCHSPVEISAAQIAAMLMRSTELEIARLIDHAGLCSNKNLEEKES